MSELMRLTGAEPEEGFRVRLTFSDGKEKVVDLEPLLRGPLFEPMLRDLGLFRKVRVSPEFGCLEWPNGADLCADMLYHGLPPSLLAQSVL